MIYDFGLRLKALRKAKHLSQADVAARLNVTRSTISGYECNIIRPSLEQLVSLALLYNASLDYIMGIENRYYLYLDDLTERQQLTIRSIVEQLRREFLQQNQGICQTRLPSAQK